MIKAIGLNKVFLILLLAGFLAAMFMYGQYVLSPSLKKQQSQLSSGKGEISSITNNLNLLTSGLEKFEKQKDDFEKIRNLGFFNPQNRVEAKQIITAIQKESRLKVKTYSIKPAVTLSNKKSKDAGYKILRTDMGFNLEAIEDADIYKFFYILNYGFPGQVIINNFSMSRDMDITQPLLRKIGVGQSEAIIKADLSVSWQTIVPDENLAVSAANSQQGRR